MREMNQRCPWVHHALQYPNATAEHFAKQSTLNGNFSFLNPSYFAVSETIHSRYYYNANRIYDLSNSDTVDVGLL